MAILNVTFTNKITTNIPVVSVGFVPGSSDSGFNITNAADNSAILPLNQAKGNGNWYSLDALTSGVNITNFSGRVYFAYGTPWSVEGANYEPAQSPADANFYLRYDKIEMTFNGDSSDVANLTSIDYWSIPISLNSQKGGNNVPGNSVTGLLNGTTAQDIYNALAPLTSPNPVSGIPGNPGADTKPLPAVVPGSFKKFGDGPTPGTTFARIIGPSSYPAIYPLPAGIPIMPYDIFTEYLTYLVNNFGPATTTGQNVPGLGAGVIATISGKFGGVGPNVPATGPQSAQDYNLTASIDDSMNITLSGTVGSVSGTTTMVFAVNDLQNPSGIYGGNTPFTLTQGGTSTFITPQNNVYGWICGDLFSGMNIGAVGSTSTVFNPPTVDTPTMAGALSSSEWFSLPTTFFFSNMQSGFPNNFNRWAAGLQNLSQAYNFAYSDRFAHVFVSLNPATVDTLEIILEPDSITM
jgi:hypothetical protein